MIKLFKALAAGLYATGVFLRNLMYDVGLLRSMCHRVPVVCVGNITVGGTGKTPTVEFLVESLLALGHRPAVLSRGYGRRTKGYLEVTCDQPFINTGDEPMQIKMKFPTIPVVVCEDRNMGVERIMKEHPQTDIVIMDDGFQHRSIRPTVNIVLLDFTRPVSSDHFLPLGTLRDERRQLRRADIFIVTKTPGELSAEQKAAVAESISLRDNQQMYFTTMSYGALRPLFAEDVMAWDEKDGAAVVFSGIANPLPFEKGVGEQCKVLESVSFADHHVYTVGDMKRVLKVRSSYKAEKPIVVTTEKDAVKLSGNSRVPEELRGVLYVLPMRLDFVGGDGRELIKDIYNVIEAD